MCRCFKWRLDNRCVYVVINDTGVLIAHLVTLNT